MKLSFAQDVSPELVADLIKPRKESSHKGTYGHALLIAGSKGKMGAAILAAKACLRTGTGLLTVNVTEDFSSVLYNSIPEAMLMSREEDHIEWEKYQSIGIGPGIGTDDKAAELLRAVLTTFKKPLLIDADALTLLSKNKEWLSMIPVGSILTPHPKEFDRLFGNTENDRERAEKAVVLSKQYPFVIILKGHHTLTAFEGKGWYNNTGNAGLAKGGSGDVLTGMLTALLAQQYDPLAASLIGVHLHGLAADITLGQQSMESMLATDVISNIGAAFKHLA